MRTLLIVLAAAGALWLAVSLVVALNLVVRGAEAWPDHATICVPGPEGRASIAPAPGVVAWLDLTTQLECPYFECHEAVDGLVPVLHATLTIETPSGRTTEEVAVTAGSHCVSFAVPR